MLLSHKLNGSATAPALAKTPVTSPVPIRGSSRSSRSSVCCKASQARALPTLGSSILKGTGLAGHKSQRSVLPTVTQASQQGTSVEPVTPIQADQRVPVTIITGFLGSGKTTLLNSILTRDHGKRVAFGEIDIDSSLVAKQEVLEGTNDSVMQLSNGCLCCTVREDLIKALNSLHSRRDEFDHIVIETTGLANPAPIISSFYMDQELPDKVRLDGVVTVVDAKHVTRHLDNRKEGTVSEAVEQIAYADRILLNKTDLVDTPALDALEKRIKDINVSAEITRTTSPHEHSHEHEHCSECGHDHAPGEPHGHSHSHDHSHEHSHSHSHADHSHASHSHEHSHSHSHNVKHDDKVNSVAIRLEGNMDLDKINYSLGLLLETRAEDMYRIKGLLSIHGSDYRYVFQGVHTIFEGTPDRKWFPDEKRECKLVFIGRELDAEAFKDAFEHCLVKEPAVAA
ncbi:CobW/HypB/UreG, nucleotide-binding domain-containing protein [Dunaliella salina]|uniref:CobW/HypB/UreG, nucleotide-binding domain-containing protein n=1 Tax=Dunaliella salina TaxID=3046 RepID=A0ABQ7FW15_DUNSA|nr:CobW/HypB/UreG, nucleotide-binding domain-containing protein [Dunaliella salina]|eukprot:KAF5826553.1 CobW/HypB/UreG, nucleotide-binding domain-containing protein [Dunaliella salina]